MKKDVKKFYDAFTELQCFILANMNRSNINGVTATNYNIIEYIYRNDNCTGKQIAKAFNISPPAISRQIKFLIENDFISQQQSSNDRRIFHMNIKDKGKFVVDNSENFRETIVQKISEKLPTEDFKNFTELLHKVVQVLTK